LKDLIGTHLKLPVAAFERATQDANHARSGTQDRDVIVAWLKAGNMLRELFSGEPILRGSP
jgi:hypothetical protein